jgi:hypothetical protein
MGDVMDEKAGVTDELLTAVEANGPKAKDPPYVRTAYPLVALPSVLRAFVRGAADALGVPPECVATPAIATCAAAIGNTFRIRLNSAWNEPSVIWAVTLMESGSLKTPAYNAAFDPLRAVQRMREEKLAEDQKAHKAAKALYDADVTAWRQQVQPGTGAYVGEPPAEPVPPVPVDLYTSDSTVEALAVLFANNPRGLALTRDELSGFFGSFGAYKGGRGSDESAYLEFYNAGSVKLNRASGKRIYVHAAALSIFGTCQPSVFLQAIGVTGKGTNQVDNGLAARFLIASPVIKPKQWHDPKPYEARHYHQMIGELLSIPLPCDADGRVEPILIPVTPAALERFKTFVNEHGPFTAAIANDALRFHYSKLEGAAARLALVFYLCDLATKQVSGPPAVQEQHILGGIALARWHGREAFRVYDCYESAAQREIRELLDEVRAHGGVITPYEMGKVRRRWGDLLAAEMALKNLARAGYGTLTYEPPGPRGGRPAYRFRLHVHPEPVPPPSPVETPEIPAFPEGLQNS